MRVEQWWLENCPGLLVSMYGCIRSAETVLVLFDVPFETKTKTTTWIFHCYRESDVRRLIAKDSDASTIVILHGDSRDCGWTVDATEEDIPGWWWIWWYRSPCGPMLHCGPRVVEEGHLNMK